MKKNIEHLVIFFFSGTGNAKKVVEWITNIAQQKGIEVQQYNISKIPRNSSYVSNLLQNTNSQIINQQPYLLFIGPTHGFNYPPILMNFILRFPRGTKRVGLLNTRAGMRIGKLITPGLSGIALLWSALVLRLKGYHINALYPVDLPSNWVSVHPAIREKGVKIIHRKNKWRVEKFAHKILQGQKDMKGLLDIIQDILIAPISLLYYFIGRFILAKTFIASPDCTNCGLCEKSCGVGAIKQKNNRPYWTHKCESCMHCMSHCPEKAIQTCHGFITVLVILITTFFLNAFYHFIENHFFPVENKTLRFIISNILFAGFIFIGYRVSHYLMRFTWYARLIEFTSLTRYKWWGKGYKALKDHEF